MIKLLLSITILLGAETGVAGRPIKFVIRNTANFSRENEVISISRKLFDPELKHNTPRVSLRGHVLITQPVDTNSDAIWDELHMAVSLPARTADTLRFDESPQTAENSVAPFTSVRLSLRSQTREPMPEMLEAVRYRGFKQDIAHPFYQMEGPGIENDKVAFRAFFDLRNGKDIYGKLKPEPLLKYVGVTGSWHELQDWGMDIFKTGNSLGAGGLGVMENGEITRLGDADSVRFKNLYAGALTASLKMKFYNWDTGKHRGNGSEQLVINKGDYFYHNIIHAPLLAGQSLLCGIARFTKDPVRFKRENERYASLSIYGAQAEGTGTRLGVAILVLYKDIVKTDTTSANSEVSNTAYVALRPQPTQHIYFLACWEKTDRRFSNRLAFEQYLYQTAERLTRPIQIKRI
jgi:hypothetical protein